MGRIRNIPGSNTAALAWADGVSDFYGFKGLTRAVLQFIATNTCFRLWRRFFIHIAAMAKSVRCCRSSVEKALKVLRDHRVIAYDGQVHVGKLRPVAVYRLSGTPECPLPQWVVEAREEALEATGGPDGEEALTCTFTHRTNTAGPTVYATPKSETPSLSSPSKAAGISGYRPAQPVKTGPQAKPNLRGGVRQPTHLRWLRSFAEGLLERRGSAGATVPVRGSQEAHSGVMGGVAAGAGMLVAESTGKVTYCHPPARGAVVNPFTDPAIGTLPPLTRLLYHGIRNLSDTNGQVPSDPRYLNSQIFPYDNLPADDVIGMVSDLIDTGKMHYVTDGYLVLSDPPVGNTVALFDLSAAAGAKAKSSSKDTEWAFDCFWDRYPRRSGKGAARKAFFAQVASGVPAARIVQAAEEYAENCNRISKEAQFIPYPATWLNQERYDDDMEQAPQVRSKVDDALRSGMELINFYQQQEGLESGSAPKELGW